MRNVPRNTILVGDALERLRQLSSASVDCVITSPPYYRLRSYDVARQIGLEATVTDWVAALRKVFVEVGRVLKPTGSLWLNLGDAYSTRASHGAPPKGLLLSPERLLLALAEDGYVVRNRAVWAKTNPMPTSVEDRFNATYDFMYLLVRQPRYYFDANAIREPYRTSGPEELLGRVPSDVWLIPSRAYQGAHFATFPPKLIERPLLASCPERLRIRCDAPWIRPAKITIIGKRSTGPRDGFIRRYPSRWRTLRQLESLRPGCACGARYRPGIVLDPFFGTGTVGVVAEQHRRDWLGIELNPAYAKLATDRLAASRSTTKEAAA